MCVSCTTKCNTLKYGTILRICQVSISKLKIFFIGSGDIAVPILTRLHDEESIEVVGVASQPDRPAGRKRVLTPSPLAKAAEGLGLTVIRAASVNNPEFLATVRASGAEMIVVASFGQLLKEELLALPRFGCVNIHASLLPRYRGASPIAMAILNRESETGVAFMRMERGLDTGAVYRMLRLPLTGEEYANSLEIALGELAAQYAGETLLAIAAGDLAAVPQDDTLATCCGKIAKASGEIDWQTMDACRIDAMVRAFTPWPGAYAGCRVAKGDLTLTLNRVKAADGFTLKPGECAPLKKRLVIGCAGDTALEVLEVTPSGGKLLNAAAFLNGLRGELPLFK